MGGLLLVPTDRLLRRMLRSRGLTMGQLTADKRLIRALLATKVALGPHVECTVSGGAGWAALVEQGCYALHITCRPVVVCCHHWGLGWRAVQCHVALENPLAPHPPCLCCGR